MKLSEKSFVIASRALTRDLTRNPKMSVKYTCSKFWIIAVNDYQGIAGLRFTPAMPNF
jgi:hypothetical protein